MNRYLFDTNILLLFLRQDTRWAKIHQTYGLDRSLNFISIVSIGELRSIGLQNDWGVKRLGQIDLLRRDFVITDINVEEIVERYAEIDAFSQGRLKGKTLGNSSRNMGKNDLWIAATASFFKLGLLTSDHDFDHLSNVFLNLSSIDLSLIQP